MRSLEEVTNYFMDHPRNDTTKFDHERVNEIFLNVATMLWEEIEPRGKGSPDKTVMLRKLSEARMQANMTIATYVEPTPQVQDLTTKE